jgi:hypothetical protein
MEAHAYHGDQGPACEHEEQRPCITGASRRRCLTSSRARLTKQTSAIRANSRSSDSRVAKNPAYRPADEKPRSAGLLYLERPRGRSGAEIAKSDNVPSYP